MGQKKFRGAKLSQYLHYWNQLKELMNLVTHAYHVMPAVNAELKKEAFKVRHDVYCSELNYEEGNEEGIETDEYDDYSTHMVLYSKIENNYIGCARLVHGQHEGLTHGLPMEHHCQGKLDHKILNMVKNSGHKYAEVSRLAIHRDHRHMGRGKGQKGSLGGQRKSSFALLSLYLGLQAVARQQNIRYLMAIVEPRLLKNLHRHNVPAIQIGEGTDHRGLRVPILIDVEDIEKIIPSVMKPLYAIIHKDISKLMTPLRQEQQPKTSNEDFLLLRTMMDNQLKAHSI